MPRELKRRGIETPIIVYTGTGTYDRCAQAVRLGTCWFIDKTERVERMGVRPKTASPEVVTRLAAYDWPKNNVRELRNCLERMMIASDDLVLRPDDVPEEIRALTTGVSPQDTVAGAATLRVLRAGAERRRSGAGPARCGADHTQCALSSHVARNRAGRRVRQPSNRNCTASARCSTVMRSAAARSAIVRATFIRR